MQTVRPGGTRCLTLCRMLHPKQSHRSNCRGYSSGIPCSFWFAQSGYRCTDSRDEPPCRPRTGPAPTPWCCYCCCCCCCYCWPLPLDCWARVALAPGEHQLRRAASRVRRQSTRSREGASLKSVNQRPQRARGPLVTVYVWALTCWRQSQTIEDGRLNLKRSNRVDSDVGHVPQFLLHVIPYVSLRDDDMHLPVRRSWLIRWSEVKRFSRISIEVKHHRKRLDQINMLHGVQTTTSPIHQKIRPNTFK